MVKDGTQKPDKVSSSLLVPSGGRTTSHSAEDFSSCKKVDSLLHHTEGRFLRVCILDISNNTTPTKIKTLQN